jgi:PAS domain-containing protein
VVTQQATPDTEATPLNPAQRITWTLRAGRYVAVPTASRDPTPRVATMAEEVEAARHALQPHGARSLGAATWHWDLATDSVEWDGGLRVLFGYAEEVTDAAWRRNLIHPGDRDRVEVSLQRATIRNDGSPWSEQYRLHQADGSYADVREQAFVLHDEAGPRSVVGAITPKPAAGKGAPPRAPGIRPRSLRECQGSPGPARSGPPFP